MEILCIIFGSAILILIVFGFILIPRKEEKLAKSDPDFSLPLDPDSTEVLALIADLFGNRDPLCCKVSYDGDHKSSELIIDMLVVVDGSNVWKSWILRSKDITPFEE